MGCHTWFYKKMPNQPSYQECKDMAIKYCTANIQECYDYINGKITDEDMINIWKQYDPLEILTECQDELNQVFNDNRQTIDNLVAHIMFLNNTERNVIRCHKGIFYISSNDLPHDVFRTWGYPEDVLESYQDFENFIVTNEYRLEQFDSLEETKQKMKQFWEKFPDGIVDFG